MKNWIVEISQKKKTGKQSKRTERRKKADGVDIKKANKNTLDNAIKYLLNDKHGNHILTNITDLGNARLTRDNIHDEYEYMKEKHGKGVANVASCFALSIPADLYHPDAEEWGDIYKNTIKNFTDNLNSDLEKKQKLHEKVDVSELSGRKLKEYHLNTERFSQRFTYEQMEKLTTGVVHDDREKPLIVGETSGSHLNIIVSNIFDGEVIKYISQKGGISAMKKAYDQAIKETLGLDCKNYIPYDSRPDNAKLKDFYTAKSDLDLVYVDENTPHKDLIKNDRKNFKDQLEPDSSDPLWLYNKKKRIVMIEETKQLDEEKEKIAVERSEADKKLQQVPKAKELIKTANKAIRVKKNAEQKTIEEQEKLDELNQKIGVSEKRLKKVNKQLKNNQQWLYKVIKSDIVQNRIETLKEIANNSIDFYISVKKFVNGLNNQNEDFLNDLKEQNPQWLRQEKARLEREEKLKKERYLNRHKGGVFEEDIELIDDLKEEVKNAPVVEKPKKQSRGMNPKKWFKKKDDEDE